MQIEPTRNADEAEIGSDTYLVDQVLEQRKKEQSNIARSTYVRATGGTARGDWPSPGQFGKSYR